VETTPWWGNLSLAHDVAQAVDLSLGTPNQQFPGPPNTTSPFAIFGGTGSLLGFGVVDSTAPSVTTFIVYSGTQFYALEGEVAAVPEPTTLFAGALMLLPFGSSAVRKLREQFQSA
jgi:hypothetical protein